MPKSAASRESREQKARLLLLLRERERRRSKEACEQSLAEFTKEAWHVIEPGTPLKWNWHLDVVCAYVQAFFEGRIKRLIMNVPPGTMKSIVFAVMGPAWKWTRAPEARMVSLTNEIGLATRDNRRMRQILDSEWYQARWGDRFKMSADQDEKTLFENTAKGFRQGLGLNGNITGKRGNFLLIDDPVDAEKAFSDVVIQGANDTYDNAVSSRLNDPVEDSIGLIMQRLRTNDLTGHLLKKKARRWVQLCIPMEYEGQPTYDPVADLGPEYAHLRDPRTKVGELMFPARFPREVVDELKENLGDYGTAGQLQQRPSPLGGGIIGKARWARWPKDRPFPACFHIFASYDTAFSEQDHKKAAYTSRTTWGVFEDELTGRHAMIVLDRWWKRVDFVELKKEARKHHRDMGLDALLIEKKASGISLIQEIKRWRGVTVRGYDPKKADKIARAHMALPMFDAGLVYAPDRQWAEELIDQVAAFPTGAPPSADVTDTVTQAVNYVRRKGWALPPEDERPEEPDETPSEEEQEDAPKRRRAAYG